ncbi:MAG: hypothetical protein IJ272_03775 [Clostridia bacterium]|nr:hypothetical protein [Clostridia bacterium]
MAFAIVLGVCIVSFIVGLILAFVCEGFGLCGFWEWVLAFIAIVFVITLMVSIIWAFCGGFNYITSPEFNYILTDEANIAEFDTKKKVTGIHDIVYLDSEKCIVYIDSTINEKGRIKVYDGDEAHLEIYTCIPKNNSTSVDLGFNRHYEYKVYVPNGYKVVPINLQ